MSDTFNPASLFSQDADDFQSSQFDPGGFMDPAALSLLASGEDPPSMFGSNNGDNSGSGGNAGDTSLDALNDSSSATIQPSAIYSPNMFGGDTFGGSGNNSVTMSPQMAQSPGMGNTAGQKRPREGSSISPRASATPLPAQLLQEAQNNMSSPANRASPSQQIRPQMIIEQQQQRQTPQFAQQQKQQQQQQQQQQQRPQGPPQGMSPQMMRQDFMGGGTGGYPPGMGGPGVAGGDMSGRGDVPGSNQFNMANSSPKDFQYLYQQNVLAQQRQMMNSPHFQQQRLPQQLQQHPQAQAQAQAQQRQPTPQQQAASSSRASNPPTPSMPMGPGPGPVPGPGMGPGTGLGPGPGPGMGPGMGPGPGPGPGQGIGPGPGPGQVPGPGPGQAPQSQFKMGGPAEQMYNKPQIPPQFNLQIFKPEARAMIEQKYASLPPAKRPEFLQKVLQVHMQKAQQAQQAGPMQVQQQQRQQQQPQQQQQQRPTTPHGGMMPMDRQQQFHQGQQQHQQPQQPPQQGPPSMPGAGQMPSNFRPQMVPQQGMGGPGMPNQPDGLAFQAQAGANARQPVGQSPQGMGQQGQGGAIHARQNSQQLSNAQRAVEQFMRSLFEFMKSRGTPITGNPVICGKPVHLYRLYLAVNKFGGCAKVTRGQLWPTVCAFLGFNLQMNPEAPRQVENSYKIFLLPFEEFLTRQRLVQQQQQQQQAFNAQKRQMTPQAGPTPQPQPQQQQQDQQQQRQQQQANQGMGMPSPVGQNSSGEPPAKRLRTPSVHQAQAMTPSSRVSASPKPEEVNDMRLPFRQQNSSMDKKQSTPGSVPVSTPGRASAAIGSPSLAPQVRPVVHLPTEGKNYAPVKRTVDRQGGFDTRYLASIGLEIDNLRPDFPLPVDLGGIDLHAISMSLQSMLAPEVRQALDKLVVLTADYRLYLKLDSAPLLLPALSRVGLKLLESLSTRKISKLVHQPPSAEPVEQVLAKADEHVKLDNIEAVYHALVASTGADKEAVPVKVEIATGEFIDHGNDLEKLDEEKLEDIVDEFKKKREQSSRGTAMNGNVRRSNSATSRTGRFGFENYSELVQASKDEYDELGSKDDEAEQFWVEATINRLLAVTTVIRNLSFMDGNKEFLVTDKATNELIWSLLYELANDAQIISHVRRRLDLIKDLVVIFSNVALNVVTENARDAFTLLLFVLSFAPVETPLDDDGNISEFGEYLPNVHRYLPTAIDIFAKVFPRSPPNRELLESILLGTCTDPGYLELLERYLPGRKQHPFEFFSQLFGMAISTIPREDFRLSPRNLELRKPLLLQALLVAENLTTLISGGEEHETRGKDEGEESKHTVKIETPAADEEETPYVVSDLLDRQSRYNVASQWLNARNGFAHVLLRAASVLGSATASQAPGRPEEAHPFARITQRCIWILRTLTKKADAHETPGKFPSGISPSVEGLLSILMTGDMDKFVVRQIFAYSEESEAYFDKAIALDAAIE